MMAAMDAASLRTNWSLPQAGYSHFKRVDYEHGEGWADTSQTRVITVDGKPVTVCRIYHNRAYGLGVVMSALSAGLMPAYMAGRLAGIVLTFPYYGGVDSTTRFVKMIFLQIGYLFAHVLTILEGIFVAPDPLHGRALVEWFEQEMNRTETGRVVPVHESASILGGRAHHFPKENPFEGGFYWTACYQCADLAVLDEKGHVVGARTFGLDTPGGRSLKFQQATDYQPYPWVRAILYVIRLLG